MTVASLASGLPPLPFHQSPWPIKCPTHPKFWGSEIEHVDVWCVFAWFLFELHHLHILHFPHKPGLAEWFWHSQLSSALDWLFILRACSWIFWQVVVIQPVIPSVEVFELKDVFLFSSRPFPVSGRWRHLPGFCLLRHTAPVVLVYPICVFRFSPFPVPKHVLLV